MSRFLLLIAIFNVSCASIQPLAEVPKHRTPQKNAKVFYPKEWNINSVSDLKNVEKTLNAEITKRDEIVILDLKGGIIDGSKQKGNGGQNENQQPLFRSNIPLIVKNGFVRNNKNAATFNAKDCGVINMTFSDIGEDAVATSRRAENFVVFNCEFLNSRKGDKSLQLNQADSATIEKNLIFGGITGVRVHESSWATSRSIAYCSENRFVGVDTAWNVSRGTLIVEKKNNYKSVRLPFKVSKNGTIENADGRIEKE
jgi:hypothetical protein